MTRVTNKHLLPVFDRPMIYYPLQQLVHAGLTDILLVTGGNNAGDFLRLLGNGREFGLERLNYTYQEGEGGIAEALGLAEHFAEGGPVVVVLGDNVFQDSIAAAVEAYRSQPGGAMILLKEVPDPERFGVAELDGERVVRVVEKPADPPSSLAVTGCYFYDQRVFEIIRGLESSRRGRARDHRRQQPIHRVGSDETPHARRLVDGRGDRLLALARNEARGERPE